MGAGIAHPCHGALSDRDPPTTSSQDKESSQVPGLCISGASPKLRSPRRSCRHSNRCQRHGVICDTCSEYGIMDGPRRLSNDLSRRPLAASADDVYTTSLASLSGQATAREATEHSGISFRTEGCQESASTATYSTKQQLYSDKYPLKVLPCPTLLSDGGGNVRWKKTDEDFRLKPVPEGHLTGTPGSPSVGVPPITHPSCMRATRKARDETYESAGSVFNSCSTIFSEPLLNNVAQLSAIADYGSCQQTGVEYQKRKVTAAGIDLNGNSFSPASSHKTFSENEYHCGALYRAAAGPLYQQLNGKVVIRPIAFRPTAPSPAQLAAQGVSSPCGPIAGVGGRPPQGADPRCTSTLALAKGCPPPHYGSLGDLKSIGHPSDRRGFITPLAQAPQHDNTLNNHHAHHPNTTTTTASAFLHHHHHHPLKHASMTHLHDPNFTSMDHGAMHRVSGLHSSAVNFYSEFGNHESTSHSNMDSSSRDKTELIRSYENGPVSRTSVAAKKFNGNSLSDHSNSDGSRSHNSSMSSCSPSTSERLHPPNIGNSSSNHSIGNNSVYHHHLSNSGPQSLPRDIHHSYSSSAVSSSASSSEIIRRDSLKGLSSYSTESSNLNNHVHHQHLHHLYSHHQRTAGSGTVSNSSAGLDRSGSLTTVNGNSLHLVNANTLNGVCNGLSRPNGGMLTELDDDPHQTPSPSDSGVAELEAILKEKDSEINLLKESMEQSEQIICKVYEEKERNWEKELKKIREEYESKLKAAQQKALSLEQNLNYQLQQERRKGGEATEGRRDRESGQQQHLEQQVQHLRQQLEETEWNLCQKSGEISLLKSQLKDCQGDQTSRGHELLALRAQVRQYAQEVERRRSETASLHELAASLRRENAELRGRYEHKQVSGGDAKDEAAFADQLRKVMQELQLAKEEQIRSRERMTLERGRWQQEKEQVLKYQRQLKLACAHAQSTNRRLTAQISRLQGHIGNGQQPPSLTPPPAVPPLPAGYTQTSAPPVPPPPPGVVSEEALC